MKKNILKFLSIFVILVLLLNNNIILATDVNELKNQQNQNAKEKEEAEKNLQEVQSQKSEAAKQVEAIESQINSYESQIDELDTKLSDLNSKISNAENQIKEKQESYTQNQELLEQRIVAAYEAGDTSYLDFMLSSESFTDLISNYYLVSEVATYDAELLDKIQKEKEAIETAKQTLENSKKEVIETKNSKQQVSSQLQQSKTEKANYVAKLSEDEKKVQAKIDQLKSDNVQIDKEIRAKQAIIEAAKKQQTASSSSGTSSSGSGSSSSSNYSGGTSSAGFIRPVNGSITTGMYYSGGGYHGAVDFGSAGINGSPVYAVASGVVITTRALTTSYGNYIIIYHPSSNLYTLYAHGQAGSICVSEGQSVKQGQQIMRVGSTGNSSGPHLHFEVRRSPGTYANRVNPTAYLP